ncbi:tRNA uridine-5-carboxymethylaminomethyl(34) synthesis GTPase MnmE [bacterium]|nr:tRNA uridine-5-carboxymethylaminomethyl(34) synthesis GTPase MnmE [bacterium]
MHTNHEDTITAISTPFGRAALGIVRVSGKDCHSLLQQIFAPKNNQVIVPFKPILGSVLLEDGKLLDEVILTYYEKPHSYTREDLAEISCHGNPIILERLLQRIIASGARLANAGEFTYRAFLNGRVDLVQAEAIKDLIEADSAHQAELALDQMSGRLSRYLQDLRTEFIELIALMEGNIDFSEEQHYDFITQEESIRRHNSILSSIRKLIGTFDRGRLIRDGFRVVISGRPNVGKSCLFNSLLGEDRAIVTASAGTTRDYLRERIVLGGYLVNLLDTAGIRESQEEIEEEGIRRSRQMIENADLILVLVDGSESLSKGDFELWKSVSGRDVLLISNKMDLENFNQHSINGCTSIPVSAKTGSGIEDLLGMIQKKIEDLVRGKHEDTLISSLRHRDLLSQAEKAVEKSLIGVKNGLSEEFPLMDLHQGMASIGEITGEVTIEDIYSHIFSHFCIGK